MTGPEHYAAANLALKAIADGTNRLTESGGDLVAFSESVQPALLVAQVHATLALAAATAQLVTYQHGDLGLAWAQAGVR